MSNESISSLPERHRPAHTENYQGHNHAVILYVTVCTRYRNEVLACERVHSVLCRSWAEARRYLVGRYVIMPDHLHLFCAPVGQRSEGVAKWVAYWKRLTSIAMPELGHIWQRDCWDTQLRQAHHYEDKWEYVRENPVRKGLVNNRDEWPYQGCLNNLML